MITRRTLIGGAALAALSSPTILRAHTEEPFVLADEFQPREVRVREQHAPGQILVFPRSFFLYHVFDTERAIRYGNDDPTGNEILAAFPDEQQWAHLASVRRIDPMTVDQLVAEAIRTEGVLGVRVIDDSDDENIVEVAQRVNEAQELLRPRS